VPLIYSASFIVLHWFIVLHI